MKQHRFWIEIVIVSTAAACAIALLIGTVSAVAKAASGAVGQHQTRPVQSGSSGNEQTYEGMVSCSRCVARHSATLGKTAADCTRTCVRDGAKFALVEGDKTYQLEGDTMELKKIAGQRASIVGVVAGNTIRVSMVSAPK